MENGRIVSYNTDTLEATSIVETTGACQGQNSAFSIASTAEPLFLFSCSYVRGEAIGCGMSISINEDGSLGEAAHTWSYGQTSSSHGIALNEVNGTRLLYTADLGSNSIWTHTVDESGNVKEIGQAKIRGEAPTPRHIKLHPNGKYAYVTLEAVNRVTSFRLDQSWILTDEDSAMHWLIPEGRCHEAPIHVSKYLTDLDAEGERANNDQYWSAAVNISPNGRYLWATARGRQRSTGYISCFLLDGDGRILKRLFIMATGTTNTTSSSLTTAPWSDEYVVFADAPGGYVEILKLDGREETDMGVEYSSARVVAKLDIEEGACCGNPVWLD